MENVYAKIIPDIDLESETHHIRERAEYCFEQEIELAEFFRVNAVLIDIPICSRLGENSVENMCRIINCYIPQVSMNLMFRVPLVVNFKRPRQPEIDEEIKENPNISWNIFQKIKRL